MQKSTLTAHRVLLHNHSTWSDGRLSLKEVVRWGERLRVSAIAMSEHDFDLTTHKWEEYVEACRLESTKACQLIPGVEYSSPDDNIHVVTVGAKSFFGARRDLAKTLAAVRSEGGASILAHPRRRNSFEKITRDLLEQIDAIEVWNRKVDGLAPVRGFSRFAKNNELAITVGMDLHTWRQIFPMWNVVVAPPGIIDGEVIANALRCRAISPACCLGKIGAALDRNYSVKIGILIAAEVLRRGIRGLRDSIL